MWVLLGEMFPLMLGSIGLAASYSFYAVCASLSIVFVLKYVNETKGKELEQMDGQ
jgi:SP family sugar:H+ symporter-like MFS transporter